MPTATPSKKANKIPNYDVHAKHHFFVPNHFKKGQKAKFKFGLKNANLATLVAVIDEISRVAKTFLAVTRVTKFNRVMFTRDCVSLKKIL